jgi:uncharacterized protein YbjQ (UPF0145 family)
MSSYGQQPGYGANPYGGQPNPYGGQPAPYGQPAQPSYGQPPYGQSQWSPSSAGYGNGSAPQIVSRSVIVVTLDAVPGRTVASVVGEVLGAVARHRDLPPELRGPNPLESYAAMLTRTRQAAVAKLVDAAEAAGADAVLGLRFDSSEITQSLSEVVAYGTAVRLAPLSAD